MELIIDNGFTNIVERQFDAGVRLGEAIARDMVAVRVGPDVTYAVVGSPEYFARRPAPTRPQELTDHDCVNLRLPTSGSLYAWEFEKDGREFSVRVDGPLTLNNIAPAIDAALDGVGLTYAPKDLIRRHVENGRLQEVLEDLVSDLPRLPSLLPQSAKPLACVLCICRSISVSTGIADSAPLASSLIIPVAFEVGREG